MLLKRLFKSHPMLPDSIIIVSGLPRSGTSLMMQMLEAGGIPVVTDHQREADVNNPKGYYEFERVKDLDKENADTTWLAESKDKVVKIVSALLQHLPADYHYQVIFMRRDIQEIVRSQKAMLTKLEKDTQQFDEEKRAWQYEQHLYHIINWLKEQSHFQILYINHQDVIQQPESVIPELNKFLGRKNLDTRNMLAVVDPSLYRQRRS